MSSELPYTDHVDREDDWTYRIDQPEPYTVEKDDMDLDESTVPDDDDNEYMETPLQRDAERAIRCANRALTHEDPRLARMAKRLLERIP